VIDEDDRQFLRDVVGVPLEEPATLAVSRFAEPVDEAGLRVAHQWAQEHGFGTHERAKAIGPGVEEVHMATRGSAGPISRHEATVVGRALRRLPRDVTLEVLAERRRRVGPERFAQEARAIQGAAAEHAAALGGHSAPLDGAGIPIGNFFGSPQPVPPASPSDPAYEQVLARSGASHPDSRFRRQLGRQP
jgi:hypothetical protein